MPLKEEEIRTIVDYHPKCGGYVKIAEENIPYSGPTIRKYWRLHHLSISKKEKTKEINPEIEPQYKNELIIVGLYEKFNGDPYEASIDSGLEFSLICNNWIDHRLPLMYNGIPLSRHYIPLEQVYGLLYHYSFCGDVNKSCTKANFEGNKRSAIDILKKYNLVPNDRKEGGRINRGEYDTHLTKEEISRIAKELRNNRGNIKEAAKRTGHRRTLVKKVIKNTGIIIDKKMGFIKIPEELINPSLENRV